MKYVNMLIKEDFFNFPQEIHQEQLRRSKKMSNKAIEEKLAKEKKKKERKQEKLDDQLNLRRKASIDLEATFKQNKGKTGEKEESDHEEEENDSFVDECYYVDN